MTNHILNLCSIAETMILPSRTRRLLAAALYIEHLESQLEAAGANVDHMRGVVTRQIALRVAADQRAARLAKDSRR